MSQVFLDATYIEFLSNLKQRIQTAQLKAARSLNSELLKLYWEIGKEIILRQEDTKWGSKFLENLAKDLQTAFPGMQGFSPRNLKFMRQFAAYYPTLDFGKQPASQLPWAHIIILMQKVKNPEIREWYASSAIEYGWSRSTLELHLGQDLYTRQGIPAEKVSNFQDKLPKPQSDLAEQTLKNPYIFDFLTLSPEAQERDIERHLTSHISKFLIELGTGFAFVGNQVPITVDQQTFYIDMLFYHLKLRSYVVIELKNHEFRPADAGQLNFYLTAVDEQLKQETDNLTLGILLCKTRSKLVAEYALRNISSPIGVSEFQLTKAMPKELKTSLPSIEQLENELNKDD